MERQTWVQSTRRFYRSRIDDTTLNLRRYEPNCHESVVVSASAAKSMVATGTARRRSMAPAESARRPTMQITQG